MNIYVETNFVLELVFEQFESTSCEEILAIGEAGHARLVVPAFSFAEPQWTLTQQEKVRVELRQDLSRRLNEIKWRKPYLDHIKLLEDTATLLVQGTEDERRRFASYQERILNVAEIIPTTGDVIRTAAAYEDVFDLSPQDAVVFASITAHLEQRSSSENCFLDKNFKDFDASPVREALRKYNCKLITGFGQGLGFIRAQLPR